MWGHSPVVPATRDAEAGELLEPGKRNLAVSRDCATTLQPGTWRQSETLSQKTSKQQQQQQKKQEIKCTVFIRKGFGVRYQMKKM